MSKLTTAVVIPTYNRPEQLGRCLSAVTVGRRKPDEIWVVDQTRDPEQRAANERVVRQHNACYLYLRAANASIARNAGAKAARSELIAYTDDDCIADRDWLASLVEEYAHTSRSEVVAAVTGRVLPLLSRGNQVAISSRVSKERRIFRADRGGMERGVWAPWDTGNGPNIMSPRAILEAIGGFREDLGPGTANRAAEDIDLLYRLARVGAIVYQPGAVVNHMGRNRASRIKSRFGYGLGTGAMFRRQMAEGDSAARSLLGLYVRHQIAYLWRSGIWGPPETALVLAGLVRGIVRPGILSAGPNNSKRITDITGIKGTE